MGEFPSQELPQEELAEQDGSLRPPSRQSMLRLSIKGAVAGSVVMTAMIASSFALGPDNPVENFDQNIKAIPEMVDIIQKNHQELSFAMLLLVVPYAISVTAGAAAGVVFGVEQAELEESAKKLVQKFRRPPLLNTLS